MTAAARARSAVNMFVARAGAAVVDVLRFLFIVLAIALYRVLPKSAVDAPEKSEKRGVDKRRRRRGR